MKSFKQMLLPKKSNESSKDSSVDPNKKDPAYNKILKNCKIIQKIEKDIQWTKSSTHQKIEKNKIITISLPYSPVECSFIQNFMININKHFFEKINVYVSGIIIHSFTPTDIDIMQSIFGIKNDNESFLIPVTNVIGGELFPYVKHSMVKIELMGSNLVPTEGIYFSLSYDTVNAIDGLELHINAKFIIMQNKFSGGDILTPYNKARQNTHGDISKWNILDDNNTTHMNLLFYSHVIALHVSFDNGTVLSNIESIKLTMGLDKDGKEVSRVWNKVVLSILFKLYNTGLVTFFPAKSDITGMLDSSINFTFYRRPYLTIKFTKEFSHENNHVYIRAVNFNCVVLNNGDKVTSDVNHTPYNDKVIRGVHLLETNY